MKNTASEPETVIHIQVAEAREGRLARVVTRLYSGWVVLGEQQFVRGYCLLLPDPVVPTLNTLGARERQQFLMDMSRVGDALLRVCGAARINYAVFGNVEPALHAHVVPRYIDEPLAMRAAHPWEYDWNAAPRFERSRDGTLAEALRKELDRMGVTRPMRFEPGANLPG